jgi:hypothetical protein
VEQRVCFLIQVSVTLLPWCFEYVCGVRYIYVLFGLYSENLDCVSGRPVGIGDLLNDLEKV